jgi:hypothetical protein
MWAYTMRSSDSWETTRAIYWPLRGGILRIGLPPPILVRGDLDTNVDRLFKKLTAIKEAGRRRRAGLCWWFEINSSEAVVPIWPFALATGGCAFALWHADIRARRRARVGVCIGCGYDRRGIAADATCPECGTVPTNSWGG